MPPGGQPNEQKYKYCLYFIDQLNSCLKYEKYVKIKILVLLSKVIKA